jgi:hypothetical protein
MVTMIRSIEPGKWYFLVDCARCLEAIPFAEAASLGDESNMVRAQVTDLKCLACGQVDSYALGLMTRRLR